MQLAYIESELKNYYWHLAEWQRYENQLQGLKKKVPGRAGTSKLQQQYHPDAGWKRQKKPVAGRMEREDTRTAGETKDRREVPLSRRRVAFCLHAQPGDHGPAVCDGAAVYRCGAGGGDHGVYGRNDKKDTGKCSE